MNAALILQALPIIAGIFLSAGQTLIKGNKKYVIAIAVYFFLKSIADKAAKEAAKDEFQVDIDPVSGNPVNQPYANPEVIAKAYRKAFDPLGTGFIGWNGTDTATLYQLAGKAVSWSAVKAAYKTLYKSDLETDLEDELSSSELKTFMGILGKRATS